MKINPSLGNSQPLRATNKAENLSFQMAPVKVPAEYKAKANTLLETFAAALKDCNSGLIEATKKKAARENVPVEIVRAAAQQAQSGQKLLIYA